MIYLVALSVGLDLAGALVIYLAGRRHGRHAQIIQRRLRESVR
jgi:hypothetical protein